MNKESVLNGKFSFKAEPTIGMEDCPQQWWSKHEGAHSEMACLARMYLATPATSVPCSHLPLSATNHRSSSVNNTWETDGVTFFIIQGLTNLGEKKIILFVILLLGYIIILAGNCMIIFVALTDPKLTSPMYFFLSNLSFVDIVYTTTTIPNMLSGFLTHMKTISIPGCFLQMYFFIHLAVTGRAILTVMAYDRYVAICNPLRYTAVMTRHVRLLLVAGAWGFGAFCTILPCSMAWHRSYCGLNVVRHSWCDPSSVRLLACGDTSVDNIVSISFSLVALLSTGVLILTSYILIGVNISKMGVSQRLKAFATCAAHLTVVSISYGSASFVYISYRVGNFSPEVRIIVSVLYAALTPFLNPIIYSLRNRELRESIWRTLSRLRSTAVLPRKDVNSQS
ncbi:olfactory receptor 10J4 [Labrus mixtus]|uniref:olfactory receptor 10J4 n=1 Tax=Labrus mixtus TaxID=508554 RepID=UPI0029C0299C|nr:olfactory receptor 10J4 [Labrus mixtus]